MEKLPNTYIVHTSKLNDQTSKSLSSWQPEWTKRGWGTTVGLGFFAALFVCVINLILLIWTVASSHDIWSQILNAYPTDNVKGIKNVYTGSCSATSSASTWAHLAINILSSVLLAASNSAMQILAAPSREEVDAAHSRRSWLDIGVQSWRNLRNVGALRRVLWILLAVTTVPLHLLYNSVILHATSENNYAVVTADHTFMNDDTSWDPERSQCFSDAIYYYGNANPAINFLQKNQGLVRLENADCISAYSRSMMPNYGNLLVVTNASISKGDDSLMHLSYMLGTTADDMRWICGIPWGSSQGCDYAEATANASQWRLPGTAKTDGGGCPLYPAAMYPVEYCLAQPTPELCSIGVAISLLVVVLVCNVIKAVCLFWTWRMMKLQPLVTVGDAISPFLERPDGTTGGYGALEARSIAWKTNDPTPVRWIGRSRIGFHAASASRWSISSILFVLFWALCLVLLELGLRSYDATRGMSSSLSFIISRGLGGQRLDSTISHPAFANLNFAPLVLLANLPQLLLSLLYLLYNDVMTRLSLSSEWAAFSRSPQPLRVSCPRGSQVRTHFLFLPWKLAIPLLVVMTILHWLVSKSIYLIYVTGFDYAIGGEWPVPLGAVRLLLGWSPLALMLSLLVGGVLILMLWVAGFAFRYGSGMPLAQGCSAAISAAYHPLEEDQGAAEHPLQYGVVADMEEVGVRKGHASFSSLNVSPLRPGEVYQ